jgi:biotin transport system substrate-specific component
MASSVATPDKLLIDIAIPAEGARRWIALALLAIAGTLVLWVSAKVSIPFYPVPMSLQTLAVMLIGGAYGWRLGLATVALYLLEGAFGLPVFAGTPPQPAGLTYLLGTTGGFLIGFAVAGAVIGWLVERGAARSPLTLFPAMLLGDALVFALGFAWLAYFVTLSSGDQGIGAAAAWGAGVAPFLLGDLVKAAIAALLIPAAAKLTRR